MLNLAVKGILEEEPRTSLTTRTAQTKTRDRVDFVRGVRVVGGDSLVFSLRRLRLCG
jgi:hypothetical protein